MYYRVLLPTACGGFDVSIKSDFLAERYILFILCDCVRTNLRNKRTIVSFDCLPVHELNNQRLSVLGMKSRRPYRLVQIQQIKAFLC